MSPRRNFVRARFAPRRSCWATHLRRSTSRARSVARNICPSPCLPGFRRRYSIAQIRLAARWNCCVVSMRSVYRIRTFVPSRQGPPIGLHDETLVEHVKRHHCQVSLGLAAASWEPDQIHDLAIWRADHHEDLPATSEETRSETRARSRVGRCLPGRRGRWPKESGAHRQGVSTEPMRPRSSRRSASTALCAICCRSIARFASRKALRALALAGSRAARCPRLIRRGMPHTCRDAARRPGKGLGRGIRLIAACLIHAAYSATRLSRDCHAVPCPFSGNEASSRIES